MPRQVVLEGGGQVEVKEAAGRGRFAPLSYMCHIRFPLPGEEGTTEKVLRMLCLKAKARIWPWMSYMCHVRSTALHISTVLSYA